MHTDRPEMPGGDDALDHLEPSSTLDMQRRLDGLADGHPSSPYNEDGSRKPHATRLRDIELPEEDSHDPAWPRRQTDSEHAEHVYEIGSFLEEARKEHIATDFPRTIDPDGEAWDKERRTAHNSIIKDLYERSADVPNEHRAIIAGGLGGAGKSTVLDQHAGIDRSQYLTINPDEIKEEMARRGMVPKIDGLSPMEACDLVHEESSHIAKQLALRAHGDGKNLIWDITMSTLSTTEGRIDDLRSAGYTHIEGIFVDIPVETSVARADARHREGHDDYLAGKGLGGRFVPEEVIRAQADADWGSLNRKHFESVKTRFDSWSMYDNSVDGGIPMLKDASRQEDTAS